MLQRALPGAPHMAHTTKQTHTRGQRHTRSPANKNIPLARFLSRRSPAHTRYLCLSGSWGVAATLISRRTTRKWCVCACVIWHKSSRHVLAPLYLYIYPSLSHIYIHQVSDSTETLLLSVAFTPSGQPRIVRHILKYGSWCQRRSRLSFFNHTCILTFVCCFPIIDFFFIPTTVCHEVAAVRTQSKSERFSGWKKKIWECLLCSLK